MNGIVSCLSRLIYSVLLLILCNNLWIEFDLPDIYTNFRMLWIFGSPKDIKDNGLFLVTCLKILVFRWESSKNVEATYARSLHSCVFYSSGCSNRRPWTEEEKQIVLTEMKKNILLEKLPGKLQCEELIGKHEELRQRSWTMIKHFVRNKITAANKHLSADKAWMCFYFVVKN